MNLLSIQKSSDRRAIATGLKAVLLCIFFVQQFSLANAQYKIRPKIAIQLLLNTQPGPENTADGVVAVYDDNFSYKVGNEDSYKFTNLDENLAIKQGKDLLSIEGLPVVKGTDTLKLVMWKFRQKSYFLSFDAANFSVNAKAFVKDRYLNKETAISLSSSTLVPFSITGDSASFARERFIVVFKAPRIFSANIANKFASAFTDNLSLSVTQDPLTGNNINVHFADFEKGKYEVNLYNEDGAIVYAGSLNYDGTAPKQNLVIQNRVPKGSYNLVLTKGDEVITKTILID